MISLTPKYVRLYIGRDVAFDAVTEMVRMALAVCRANSCPAAVIVSEQSGLDWRSSLRVAIRFVSSRWDMAGLKVGLVILHIDEKLRKDVCKVAMDAGLECNVFNQEADAIKWVSG